MSIDLNDVFNDRTKLETLIEESEIDNDNDIIIDNEKDEMIIPDNVDISLKAIFIEVDRKPDINFRKRKSIFRSNEKNLKIRRLERLEFDLVEQQTKNEEIIKEFVTQLKKDDSLYKNIINIITRKYKRRKTFIYNKMTNYVLETNKKNRILTDEIKQLILGERIKMKLIKEHIGEFFKLIIPWLIYETNDYMNLSLTCKDIYNIIKNNTIGIHLHEKKSKRICIFGKDNIGKDMNRLEYIKLTPYSYELNNINECINYNIKRLTFDFKNEEYENKFLDSILMDKRFINLNSIEIINSYITGKELIKLISMNINQVVLFNCIIENFKFSFYQEYFRDFYSVDIKTLALINCDMGGFKLMDNVMSMPFENLFICSTESKKYYSKRIDESFCKYCPNEKHKKFFLLFDAKNLPKKGSLYNNIIKYGNNIDWKVKYSSLIVTQYVNKVNEFCIIMRNILDESMGDRYELLAIIYRGINRFRLSLNVYKKKLIVL